MASTCISNCVNDIAVKAVPVRATYVNLYKWPESDAEFIKSVSSRMNNHNNNNNVNTSKNIIHPKVVDSISCRQLYLRSYTFSREEEEEERLNDDDNNKTTSMRCYGRKKKGGNKNSNNTSGGSRRKCNKGLRRVKQISCVAFSSIFGRLLSCTVKVDVVG